MLKLGDRVHAVEGDLHPMHMVNGLPGNLAKHFTFFNLLAVLITMLVCVRVLQTLKTRCG